MKKIFYIPVILLLIVGLAALGLLGYGLATHRFSPERRHLYLASWRGENLEPPPAQVLAQAAAESPQQAGARIAAEQVQKEVLSRDLQRQVELVQSMKDTLGIAQDKLQKDLKTLQTDKKNFADALAHEQQALQDVGFQKALKSYSTMKASQVKDDFMKLTDEEVVRYLGAMKADVATGILERFRTPEEQDKRLRVMKLLEEQGKNLLADLGRTPGGN